MREYIIFFPTEKRNKIFGITMCGITYPDSSYKISRKKSNIYCFEYVYSGEGTVLVDGIVHKIKEGDSYILPMEKSHFYYSNPENPWKKIWFNIYGDFVENTIKTYGLYGIVRIKNAKISELFEEFVSTAEKIEKNKDEAVDYDKCALIFLKIVQRLSKKIHSETQTEIYSKEDALKNKIDSITDFKISFDDIISEFYCTKSHLIRKFKSKYGITPYDYLLERKILFAKSFLSESGMSISEIAEYLGFNDCHYFSNFFKKRTGISPLIYRNL